MLGIFCFFSSYFLRQVTVARRVGSEYAFIPPTPTAEAAEVGLREVKGVGL